MRETIIVTIKDEKKRFSSYDVEVPVDISAKKAAGDIVEVLNCYKASVPALPQGVYRLKDERLGIVLPMEKKLYESGVWQGDVLILTE